MMRKSPTRIRHRAGSPSSFFTPAGRGDSARALILLVTRVAVASGSLSISLTADGLTVMRYSATSSTLAASEAPRDHVERDALFMCARRGDELIVNVFPQRAVTFEIDLHGDLLALLVGDEMNAFHRCSSCGPERSSHEHNSHDPLPPARCEWDARHAACHLARGEGM